jgi:5'-deoxynucleotidase YfbR-like HD superfamily hydrolase
MTTVMEIYQPKKTEVETSTGKYLDMENPTPDAIELEDIAHSLGNICRYNGHCLNYYSVAEHAVFVSKRLERKGYSKLIQLAGLHHDDAEAFLGDIPRPLKPLLGEKYVELTDAVDCAVVEGLDLPFQIRVRKDETRYVPAFHDPDVKAADDWSLFVEARHLLPSQGKGWIHQPTESRLVVPDYYLDGVPPKTASRLYLARHKELTR